MYAYNQVDQQLVDERVAQFRDQTTRYLAGNLDEEVFKQLRLRNGLYVQRHAPMLRVAVPYGILNSTQLRMLANIARIYDRGYAHVTTRQNFQFNWPDLESVPDILAELAKVQMHAIQTSGNCIRNVTSDPLAGVAADELEDPRVWCELLRQWSTLHPEFSYLPRKFKIAVTGSPQDRVASQVHDIGLQMMQNEEGETGFRILVGGGLGRTPVVGKLLRAFLPRKDLLSYLDAILRVYNLHGRRDNLYRARIKILVNQLGIDTFREQVEAEWQHVREGSLKLTDDRIDAIVNAFGTHHYELLDEDPGIAGLIASNPVFASWYRQNTRLHKVSGYRIVFLSLKNHGQAPGDISDTQMQQVAQLADQYSFGEIRTTYSQNLIFAHVEQTQLLPLWQALARLGLANPNIDTANDIICCPGFDFCTLANATSIDVAEDITRRFEALDRLFAVGDIKINISGCMNACGHHHVGHIGLLGVDKSGEDWYQITLGGSAGNDTALGRILGPAVAKQHAGRAVEAIIETYIELREPDETFLETLRRAGPKPFKERVYDHHN
ncbi:MAG: nitrite/sulfite reductase [Gammaproteobacteria bacterium]|nr:nitrite/sulfite reductase [Gammaproteobacteria bacterium]